MAVPGVPRQDRPPETRETSPADERARHAPRLSGKANAALLFACFALAAAIALPLTRHLPLWIRFETALAAWWLIWAAVLARILYRAAVVADDHMLGPFRSWFARRRGAAAPPEATSKWWYVADALSIPLDLEGCGVVLVVLFGLVLLVLALWLLVEVLVPIVAFAAYALLRGMLATVARFGDRCRGRLGPALGWAVLFATVYVAPLAGAVWLGHVLRAARLGGPG